MSRDWRLFWSDIVTVAGRGEHDTAGMSREQFASNQLVFDAVIRNLELIGDAAKNLPPDVLALAPTIKWQLIRRMRNILAHAYFRLHVCFGLHVYFGSDDDIIWEAISHDIPIPRRTLEAITRP